MSWTDAGGDLWMFGGQGRDVAGTAGALSDLWKFSIATRQWTWVSGADVVNSPGMYGVQNAPSTANRPGARSNGTSWIDSTGTLWLFGGYGRDSTGAAGSLDDLWQFTPATGSWSWISGSITAAAGSAQ
jgi:N-acetylneuraminic acid mutarotase